LCFGQMYLLLTFDIYYLLSLTFDSVEMTTEEKRALEKLRELPVVHDDEGDLENFDFGDVLAGSAPLEISHAGGEFMAIARAISDVM
jgi:hypothetical protein